MGLIICE